MFWITKNDLRRINNELREENEYLKLQWSVEYERYLLYKAKVIELNTEIEALREDMDRYL